jgi:hypothetical protein
MDCFPAEHHSSVVTLMVGKEMARGSESCMCECNDRHPLAASCIVGIVCATAVIVIGEDTRLADVQRIA